RELAFERLTVGDRALELALEGRDPCALLVERRAQLVDGLRELRLLGAQLAHHGRARVGDREHRPHAQTARVANAVAREKLLDRDAEHPRDARRIVARTELV